MKKAYDWVNREFLIKMMYGRGFYTKWMKNIKSMLDKGSVRVRINDINSYFFGLVGCETGRSYFSSSF